MKSRTICSAFEAALGTLACLALLPILATAAETPKTEANRVVELRFDAARPHPRPFVGVLLDVVFTDPSGAQKTIPAFWAGGSQWRVRYSSPIPGLHRYLTRCDDTSDTG